MCLHRRWTQALSCGKSLFGLFNLVRTYSQSNQAFFQHEVEVSIVEMFLIISVAEDRLSDQTLSSPIDDTEIHILQISSERRHAKRNEWYDQNAKTKLYKVGDPIRLPTCILCTTRVKYERE